MLKGRPLHDVTGRLFGRAALTPRSRARHHQNTCAGNGQKLVMHSNLRRFRKHSLTKRDRCGLGSAPAGSRGMTAAQFTCNEPRQVNIRAIWHLDEFVAGVANQIKMLRICAWSPQAEVQITIGISIYAESSNYPDYNWYAHALKTL
jgi:hypothetical protein